VPPSDTAGDPDLPPAVLAVLDLAARWDRVLVDNDPVAIGRFMTDDWVYVDSTGPVSKSDILGWIASGRLVHDSMEIVGEVLARSIGGTVVLTARKRSTGRWEGHSYSADEWITEVYRGAEGGWQCAFSQKTDARPPDIAG
jgi:hypothetical protein